jgi:hypothetical protein
LHKPFRFGQRLIIAVGQSAGGTTDGTMVALCFAGLNALPLVWQGKAVSQ